MTEDELQAMLTERLNFELRAFIDEHPDVDWLTVSRAIAEMHVSAIGIYGEQVAAAQARRKQTE